MHEKGVRMINCIFINRKPVELLSKIGSSFSVRVPSSNIFSIGEAIEVIWINTYKGIHKFNTIIDSIEETYTITFTMPIDVNKIQRRKHVRVDTNLKCKTSCFTSDKIYNLKTPLDLYILDLSESGMRIACEYEFPTGANILSDLYLNDVPIKITIQIVRDIPSKNKKLPFQFGCNIVSISAPDVLRNYIFQIMREDLKRGAN